MKFHYGNRVMCSDKSFYWGNTGTVIYTGIETKGFWLFTRHIRFYRVKLDSTLLTNEEYRYFYAYELNRI